MTVLRAENDCQVQLLGIGSVRLRSVDHDAQVVAGETRVSQSRVIGPTVG